MGLISLSEIVEWTDHDCPILEESVQFRYGEFLRFLAYLSVSLGVLNLLPVPGSGWGHLLYYGIELVTRRPCQKEYR